MDLRLLSTDILKSSWFCLVIPKASPCFWHVHHTHGNIDRTASNRRYGPTLAAAAARMKMHHFRHLKAAEMATPAVAARRARGICLTIREAGGNRMPVRVFKQRILLLEKVSSLVWCFCIIALLG